MNCIHLKTYKTLKEDKDSLKKSKGRVRMYNVMIMKLLGTTKLQCTCNRVMEKVKFEVLPEAPCRLLTGNNCKDFWLVSFNKEKLVHLIISEEVKMKAGALMNEDVTKSYKTFYWIGPSTWNMSH